MHFLMEFNIVVCFACAVQTAAESFKKEEGMRNSNAANEQKSSQNMA